MRSRTVRSNRCIVKHREVSRYRGRRLLAQITNAALRPTRASDTPFAARQNRMVRLAGVYRDMVTAEVVPSEELRSFLLRFYSAWGTRDFESSRYRQRSKRVVE